MDLRKIKTLLQLMNENGLAEMELEEEGIKIKFSKYSSHGVPMMDTVMPNYSTEMAPVMAAPIAAGAEPEAEGESIKSLMPGTYYSAPSPDQAPYIKVGDVVDEETVVCIIEAMKVMNEIKAECSGKIVEILAENGDPVEYGQPLFRIA